jgi:hypothetical protein
LAPVLFVDPSADVQVVVGTDTPTVRTEPVGQLRPSDLPPTTTTSTTTTTTPVTAPATNLDGTPAVTTPTVIGETTTSVPTAAEASGGGGDAIGSLDLCAG